MSEMLAFREGVSIPSKEIIMRYVAETLSHITTLEPPLHLVPWAGVNVVAYEKTFMSCYDAGHNAAQQSIPITTDIIPRDLLQSQAIWAQGIGLLCLAAGYMSASKQPLTHNRLCDSVKQFSGDVFPANAEVICGFATIRGVALPVFRRLKRDGHSSHVMLLQTLLHLIAWRSVSPYARQQAQRLLWLGGVLGEQGDIGLIVLDKELREQPVGEDQLPALLIFTDFLAHFPAGPIFVD